MMSPQSQRRDVHWIVLFTTAAAAARAAEPKSPGSDMPDRVVPAVEELLGSKLTVEGWGSAEDGSGYRISGKSIGGRHVSAEVMPHGYVHRLDVEVPRDAVPQAVLDVLDEFVEGLVNYRSHGPLIRRIRPYQRDRYAMQALAEISEEKPLEVRLLEIEIGTEPTELTVQSRVVDIRDYPLEDFKFRRSWVPDDVLQAAEQAVQGTDIEWEENAAIGRRNGVTVYEFNGIRADGRKIEVHVTSTGDVLDVETEVPLEELPRPVRDALAVTFRRKWVEAVPRPAEPDIPVPDNEDRQAVGTSDDSAEEDSNGPRRRPAFDPRYAEESVRRRPADSGGEHEVWYELTGRTLDGDWLSVEVRGDGEFVRIAGQPEVGDMHRSGREQDGDSAKE